jgi:hypothetical protein
MWSRSCRQVRSHQRFSWRPRPYFRLAAAEISPARAPRLVALAGDFAIPTAVEGSEAHRLTQRRTYPSILTAMKLTTAQFLSRHAFGAATRPLARLGASDAASGHLARAREIMPDLEKRQGATAGLTVAEVLLALDEPATAFELVERVLPLNTLDTRVLGRHHPARPRRHLRSRAEQGRRGQAPGANVEGGCRGLCHRVAEAPRRGAGGKRPNLVGHAAATHFQGRARRLHRADHPRNRGARPPVGEPDQRRNRRGALHQREDRECACLEPVAKNLDRVPS